MVDKIFDTLFERYPSLKVIRDELYTAYELMCDCYDAYGKILICGNGGSSADADHIVGELMKGFNLKRPLSDDDIEFFDGIEGGTDIAKKLQGGLPAISLSAHSALMTAFCNDVDPDLVFAQQVWAYSKNSPDLLIALSTSGNSTNVVNAVKTANAVGIDSIGITDCYDVILSGDENLPPKPAPDIYLTAAEKLGVLPEECIVYEDSYRGITAGKQAGMTVIARRDDRFRQDQSGADHIVKDIYEMASIVSEGEHICRKSSESAAEDR